MQQIIDSWDNVLEAEYLPNHIKAHDMSIKEKVLFYDILNSDGDTNWSHWYVGEIFHIDTDRPGYVVVEVTAAFSVKNHDKIISLQTNTKRTITPRFSDSIQGQGTFLRLHESRLMECPKYIN